MIYFNNPPYKRRGIIYSIKIFEKALDTSRDGEVYCIIAGIYLSKNEEVGYSEKNISAEKDSQEERTRLYEAHEH